MHSMKVQRMKDKWLIIPPRGLQFPLNVAGKS